MRLRLTIISAVASALIFTSVAAADAVPRKFWGVHGLDAPTQEDTRLMNRAGVGMMRMQINWRAVEPHRPLPLNKRNYDWSRPDASVAELARAGVAAHATLIGVPWWVNSEQLHTPMDTEEGRKGWRDFVRAAVKRYGRGGDFWAGNPDLPEQPITVFQIWNEQNAASRYLPKPNVKDYAGLLQLAAKQIRSVDPRARVVLGGMFGTPGHQDAIYAWRFLRQLYSIRGARENFDSVAAHPYAPNVRGIRYQLRRFRKAMRNAGDARTPLDITELGWSSKRSDSFFFYVGPKQQARKLKRSFRMLMDKRRQWRIQRVIWFGWRDTSRSEKCLCEKFGLVNEKLGRKRAFRPYRQFATGRWR